MGEDNRVAKTLGNAQGEKRLVFHTGLQLHRFYDKKSLIWLNYLAEDL